MATPVTAMTTAPPSLRPSSNRSEKYRQLSTAVAITTMWNLAFVAVSAVTLISSVNKKPDTPLRAWRGFRFTRWDVCCVCCVCSWCGWCIGEGTTPEHPRRFPQCDLCFDSALLPNDMEVLMHPFTDVLYFGHSSSSRRLEKLYTFLSNMLMWTGVAWIYQVGDDAPILYCSSRRLEKLYTFLSNMLMWTGVAWIYQVGDDAPILYCSSRRLEKLYTFLSNMLMWTGVAWIYQVGDDAPILYWVTLAFNAYNYFCIDTGLPLSIPSFSFIKKGASEADISKLPKYIFEEADNEEQGRACRMVPMRTNAPGFSVEYVLLTMDVCCCICLCNYDHGAELCSLLPCNHHFHAACLRKWLLRRANCPLCRRTLLCEIDRAAVFVYAITIMEQPSIPCCMHP